MKRLKLIKRLSIIFGILLILAVTAISITGVLLYKGKISFAPSDKKYPVRGVDVSYYQGDIDWPVLASQNIQFAFIKATEGSSYTDPRFSYNIENALKTDLYVGAYHFFSFESAGSTQADNFISAVEKTAGMLAPVIDVEFYGAYNENLPDKDATIKELSDMLKKLENYYGVKPIIYATIKSYNYCIKGNFDDYDLWIRNVYFSPTVLYGKRWRFWQYEDSAVLDGYSGEQKYIDMNVFNGSLSEFSTYVQK